MIEFVSYNGKYPNLCRGTLIIKVNGKKLFLKTVYILVVSVDLTKSGMSISKLAIGDFAPAYPMTLNSIGTKFSRL